MNEIKLNKKERELVNQIDKSKLPNHVAIIMDGNGRWAKKRGLPRIKGHERGIKSVLSVIEIAKHIGIKYLTLYTFSKENWKRPKSEISHLTNLLKKYLKENQEKFKDDDVKFNTIGDIEDFDEELQELIKRTMKNTKNHKGMKLTLALSYGGRQEILKAVKKIVEAGVKPDEISEKKFRAYLSNVPDVDLLIRTSGELRISNYLLWQISYAELYFTKVLWPDFKKAEFLKAIIDYQKRERRFGEV